MLGLREGKEGPGGGEGREVVKGERGRGVATTHTHGF